MWQINQYMSEDINKVSYCVGVSLGSSLMQQDLQELDPQVIAEAITDIFNGREPKYAPQDINQTIQTYIQQKEEQKYGANLEAGAQYLLQNAEKPGVHVTSSGLQYEVLTEGNGEKPGPTSTVTVHYHGTLIDGTVFDSSVQRGNPATFGVNQVIKGWTEALQLMSKGAKYRLYIPQDLAYGANPHPGGPIQPYMALIFDVELLDIA